MSGHDKLQALVATILKTEARRGVTTKRGTVALVMNKINNGGGPERYGIGRAELHMALAHIVGVAVDRQLKCGLPDNVIHLALRNAPPELVQVLPKLPAWIAVSEKTDAEWIPSLQATASQWQANAKLKEGKAKQTLKKASASRDVALFLAQYGMHSLSDVVRVAPDRTEAAA